MYSARESAIAVEAETMKLTGRQVLLLEQKQATCSA
jgi:hypothetical protein